MENAAQRGQVNTKMTDDIQKWRLIELLVQLIRTNGVRFMHGPFWPPNVNNQVWRLCVVMGKSHLQGSRPNLGVANKEAHYFYSHGCHEG